MTTRFVDQRWAQPCSTASVRAAPTPTGEVSPNDTAPGRRSISDSTADQWTGRGTAPQDGAAAVPAPSVACFLCRSGAASCCGTAPSRRTPDREHPVGACPMRAGAAPRPPAAGAHPGSGRALPLAFLRTNGNINDYLHFTSVMAATRILSSARAAPNHCASSRATPPEPSSSTCAGEASAR